MEGLSSHGPSTVDTIALASSTSWGIHYFNGWNFPVLPIGNAASLGINPNAVLGVGLSDGIGLFVEAPVYLTFKYGTDAIWSKVNRFDQKFGFAAGIGLHGLLGYSEAPISTTGIGVSYLLPTAMFEISFVTNQTTIHKIRAHTNLKMSKVKDLTEEIGYNAEIAYNQFGFSYIRTLYGQ